MTCLIIVNYCLFFFAVVASFSLISLRFWLDLRWDFVVEPLWAYNDGEGFHGFELKRVGACGEGGD